MYDPSKADAICARLAEGESLYAICKDDDMPAESTVRLWESQHPDFAANSMRAREAGCHRLAEQCLSIADDGTNDWMERNGGDAPGYALNGEHVQRSRLRIDTRMRLIGKWLPKVYGDKVTNEVTGADGKPFEAIVRRVVDPSPKP